MQIYIAPLQHTMSWSPDQFMEEEKTTLHHFAAGSNCKLMKMGSSHYLKKIAYPSALLGKAGKFYKKTNPGFIYLFVLLQESSSAYPFFWVQLHKYAFYFPTIHYPFFLCLSNQEVQVVDNALEDWD